VARSQVSLQITASQRYTVQGKEWGPWYFPTQGPYGSPRAILPLSTLMLSCLAEV
jgi:hypothetical protein